MIVEVNPATLIEVRGKIVWWDGVPIAELTPVGHSWANQLPKEPQTIQQRAKSWKPLIDLAEKLPPQVPPV